MDNKLVSLLKVPTTKKSMAETLLRYLIIILFAFTVFGLVLFIAGKNPIRAYADTFSSIFGSFYGFSELWVQMIPIMLTAVAVALPSKMNLINIGGEGQLFMGGWLATWAALTFQGLPKIIFIPVLMLFGFLGGALWAAIPGLLKAKKLVNETISTLMLNFIAPLIISLSVFGPWRSAESAAYPQTPAFVFFFLHHFQGSGLDLFGLFTSLGQYLSRTFFGFIQLSVCLLFLPGVILAQFV